MVLFLRLSHVADAIVSMSLKVYFDILEVPKEWLYPLNGFYELKQMKEIKALKKLARDLSNEKETLLQKTEEDAAIISRMSQEAFAKEDELSQLRLSLETLQSGRPDAFVMNGACVPGLPAVLGMKSMLKGENADVYIENGDAHDEVLIRTVMCMTSYICLQAHDILL